MTKVFLHPVAPFTYGATDGPGGCRATVEVKTNEAKHQHE